VEHRLLKRGPVLRAGFSWEAENQASYNPVWISHPVAVHFGVGLPLSKFLIVDLGYQYRDATYAQPSQASGPADLTIDASGQQMMGSLRLRW
jgi:hypothetical protein